MATLLRYITDEDEARLLAGAQRRSFADGEVILREGERSHSLFIVRGGGARVERSHGEFTVEISSLGEGELFGEMGFVEDFAASASVVADGACEVQVVEEAHVHGLAQSDPGFAGRFYRSVAEVLSRRLRATSVDALSEFSWGTGSFQRPETEPDGGADDGGHGWGGGSPLREGPHGP